MSETPRVDKWAFDAMPGGQEVVSANCARELEELLKAAEDENEVLHKEIERLDEMVMRWFKAASPYATPGSLEEGLKDVERFRILSEYVAAIIWKKDSDLPPLGHLKSGFSIDDLRAWCDGASAPKCDHDLVVVEDHDLPQYCWFSRCRKCGAECSDPSELSAP
jgi:hypothetical protein